jgi:hypothetical protein
MRAVASAAALTCFLCATSQAGAVLESGMRDLPNGKEKQTTTMLVDNGMVHVETLETGKTSPESGMIFKNDTLIMLDHRKKTYTVMDKATLQQWAEKAGAVMKQMEKQLAGMTPEQRAKVEKMMGKTPGGQKPKHVPPEYVRTARTEKAGSYRCQVWEGRREGAKVLEVCTTTTRIAGGDELIQAMKRMTAMTEDALKSLDSPWLQDSMSEEWEAIGKIEGFPVVTRTFTNGKAETETTLKSARSEAVPASQFEPPTGYTRKTLDFGS